jgi:CheY-like chemotaxis protein
MDRQFTILLAEDNLSIRAVVAQILREHGFNVLVSEGGDEAIQLLVAHKVDLLLTDVMPGTNGFDLALHAKSIRPNLRLLYMTGYNYYYDETADKDILYGRVIHKPFGAGQLLAEIVQALAG